MKSCSSAWPWRRIAPSSVPPGPPARKSRTGLSVLVPRIIIAWSWPPTGTRISSATLPASGAPVSVRMASVLAGRMIPAVSASRATAATEAMTRRAMSPARAQPWVRGRPSWRRRARPAPRAAPRIIGSSARTTCRPRPRTRARMPKLPPPPSRMPSTSGPAVAARVSSKTAANRTGVSSIAHRLRINHPPRAPTARLVPMAVSACRVVIGPRGVHQPASRPHPAARISAAAMPARRSRRGCASGVSVRLRGAGRAEDAHGWFLPEWEIWLGRTWVGGVIAGPSRCAR